MEKLAVEEPTMVKPDPKKPVPEKPLPAKPLPARPLSEELAMGPRALDGLQHELILEICENLDKPSIAKLARTSKKFLGPATQVLHADDIKPQMQFALAKIADSVKQSIDMAPVAAMVEKAVRFGQRATHDGSGAEAAPTLYAWPSRRFSSVPALHSDNPAQFDAFLKCYADMMPLHIVAGVGSDGAVKYLLDDGEFVDTDPSQFRWQATPLFWAVAFGREPTAHLLLDRGADPEAAIHLACANGQIELVRRILRERPDLVHAETADGLSPLLFTLNFSKHNPTPIIAILLERGAIGRPKPGDSFHAVAHAVCRAMLTSPPGARRSATGADDPIGSAGVSFNLWWACSTCAPGSATEAEAETFVKRLIGRGADPNHLHCRVSVLTHAVRARQNSAVIRVLLDAGARIDDDAADAAFAGFSRDAVCDEMAAIIDEGSWSDNPADREACIGSEVFRAYYDFAIRVCGLMEAACLRVAEEWRTEAMRSFLRRYEAAKATQSPGGGASDGTATSVPCTEEAGRFSSARIVKFPYSILHSHADVWASRQTLLVCNLTRYTMNSSRVVYMAPLAPNLTGHQLMMARFIQRLDPMSWIDAHDPSVYGVGGRWWEG